MTQGVDCKVWQMLYGLPLGQRIELILIVPTSPPCVQQDCVAHIDRNAPVLRATGSGLMQNRNKNEESHKIYKPLFREYVLCMARLYHGPEV